MSEAMPSSLSQFTSYLEAERITNNKGLFLKGLSQRGNSVVKVWKERISGANEHRRRARGSVKASTNYNIVIVLSLS